MNMNQIIEQIKGINTLNKLSYVGKDKVFGSKKTVQVTVKSMSKISIKSISELGLKLIYVEPTSDNQINVIFEVA